MFVFLAFHCMSESELLAVDKYPRSLLASGGGGQRIPVSNASSLLFSVVQVAALLCLATERQYGLGGVSERSLFGTLGSLALYSLTVKVHMGTEETLRWHFNTKSCGWWGSPGHLSLSGWGWPEANLTPEPGV